MHRGEHARAESTIAPGLSRAREIAEPQLLFPTLATAGLVALATGDREGARALLDEHRVLEDAHPSYDVGLDSLWLMTTALGLGDVARAEAFVSGPEPWAACSRHALAHGRGLIAEAEGRLEAAGELYAEAAAGWETWGSVPLRAYSLLGLGRCRNDTTALAEGDEIFTRLGATPLSFAVAA